jgi:hypothetical protein
MDAAMHANLCLLGNQTFVIKLFPHRKFISSAKTMTRGRGTVADLTEKNIKAMK